MRPPIKILFEDDTCIVFDKPSGLLVIPTPHNERNTLIDVVNTQLFSILSVRLHPCHRLDRDTSGAILFAKGKKNQKHIMEEFRRRQVEKRYIAFVKGVLRPAQGTIRMAVRDFHARRPPRQGPSAKPAITHYQVLSVQKGFSVVLVSPETGRTNQIRIHFSRIGHPLLGERLYAFGRDFPVKFRRLALHASELNWTHPVTKKQIQVTSPLPKDMENFWKGSKDNVRSAEHQKMKVSSD